MEDPLTKRLKEKNYSDEEVKLIKELLEKLKRPENAGSRADLLKSAKNICLTKSAPSSSFWNDQLSRKSEAVEAQFKGSNPKFQKNLSNSYS